MKRLELLRRAHNLSREELANRIHCNPMTIGRMERGTNTNPTFEIMSRLERVLGCSATELLRDVPVEQCYPPKADSEPRYACGGSR